MDTTTETTPLRAVALVCTLSTSLRPWNGSALTWWAPNRSRA
ncbi:hypothetical protein [Streptomyces sp. NPDC101115]